MKLFKFTFPRKVCSRPVLVVPDGHIMAVYGRFAYGSFRLLSVRLRLESIRLRPICQFAYVLNYDYHFVKLLTNFFASKFADRVEAI